jgi:hypothetical protein
MKEGKPQGSSRDHRIDFLRGLALAEIFINHVPGNLYSYFTHTNFGFSDAAEVFVMLAGFASAYAYFAHVERGERWDSAVKAWRRAGVLYMSHIVTTIAGIALFSAAAIWFARPGYLADMIYYLNLKEVFESPAASFIGIVTMGHQLGYFNILPMYMGILSMLPIMMWLAERGLKVLLIASIALWLIAGTFVIDMPNYPKEGGWFFNPLPWQLLFVIGFIFGQWARQGKSLAFSATLYKLAVVYLIVAFVWVWFRLWWLVPHIPLPLALWDFDKTYVSLPRLFHVLALAYVVMMSPLGEWMRRIPPSNPITAMGRHSLPVFCAGTLLSMAGAIARYEWGDSFAHDTIIIAVGLGLQMLLARALDARTPPTLKREARAPLPSRGCLLPDGEKARMRGLAAGTFSPIDFEI